MLIHSPIRDIDALECTSDSSLVAGDTSRGRWRRRRGRSREEKGGEGRRREEKGGSGRREDH